jgi:hypothetical protein
VPEDDLGQAEQVTAELFRSLGALRMGEQTGQGRDDHYEEPPAQDECYGQALHVRRISDMTGQAAAGPQAARWGGLSWSPWHDFDQAHREHLIPATSGLYRFRACSQPGLR